MLVSLPNKKARLLPHVTQPFFLKALTFLHSALFATCPSHDNAMSDTDEGPREVQLHAIPDAFYVNRLLTFAFNRPTLHLGCSHSELTPFLLLLLLLWWRFVATQGSSLVYSRRDMQCRKYVFTFDLSYPTQSHSCIQQTSRRLTRLFTFRLRHVVEEKLNVAITPQLIASLAEIVYAQAGTILFLRKTCYREISLK